MLYELKVQRKLFSSMIMGTFKEDWVVVNNIPTHVCTWGEWITDKLVAPMTEQIVNSNNNNKPVILLLSGNPGIIRFYHTFLQTIHNAVNVPVWILSHAGHENSPKESGMPSAPDTRDFLNVESQVSHKAEFIRQYISPDRDVYIIAHSFGAKITIELLKQTEFRDRIKKCYLLFPTLERIGDTKNGRKIKFINSYLFTTIMVLSFIFSVLPHCVKWWIIKIYFTICGRHKIDLNCVNAVVDLVNPTSLRNVFNLADDEMDVIRDLDKEVIQECIHKLRVYFGTADDWAPLEYHYNLLQQVPKVDSNILDNKYEHCFVLETAEDLGLELSKQINNDINYVK